MFDLNLIAANLTSPAVLAFIIGALAAFLRSDLRVPPQVLETISMYLLFSIGLKGGLAMRQSDVDAMLLPALATLVLGVLTPLISYVLARKLGKLSIVDAAAMAAHFGSVSAVTFMAALGFIEAAGLSYEGFLTALLVLLEIPGIVIALALAGALQRDSQVRLGHVVREAFTGKSIILLTGGLLVGLVGDETGLKSATLVFITPFHGVLVFFLLELGYVASMRVREVRGSLPFMIGFGTLVPVMFGAMGAVAADMVGLSAGGATVFATMVASASYIAAPAAVRMALPQANPALYLTTSISITLPFNLAIGIPLYYTIVQHLMLR